jgi:hypothetical protein
VREWPPIFDLEVGLEVGLCEVPRKISCVNQGILMMARSHHWCRELLEKAIVPDCLEMQVSE